MNKMNKLMVLASLLAAPTLALASETAPMSVTGTFTPSACSLSLDKTSIDMGEIPLGALATAKDYDAVSVAMTVDCGTSFQRPGLTITDNKEAPDTTNTHYGLGKAGSNQIGYYTITALVSGSRVQGNLVPTIIYSDGGTTGHGSSVGWVRDGTREVGWAYSPDGGRTYTWGGGTQFLMNTQVVTHINALTSLTANTPIDGNATITVHYH